MTALLLGPRALLDIAIPTGVDAGEVLRWTLKDGVTVEAVLNEAAMVLGAANEMLNSTYGGFWNITTSQFGRTRQGEDTRSETPDLAEFGTIDAVRSRQIGHMLPIRDHRDALAWSAQYLRDAYLAQIDDDLALVSERWENKIDRLFWTRALTNTENAIGSAGYDVGWAIGTGTNVNYIPPQYRGQVFTSSHTHFEWSNASTDGGYNALLDAMMAELRHHGHDGVLDAVVAYADLSTVTAMTRFVEYVPTGVVMPGGNTSTAMFAVQGEVTGIPGDLFGLYKSLNYGTCRLWSHNRIPTAYAFMSKSYGLNNQRNGMGNRVHPRGDLASGAGGFGLRPDPQMSNSWQRTLTGVHFDATTDFGVWDRTNGVAGYRAAGAAAYVNPTIS